MARTFSPPFGGRPAPTREERGRALELARRVGPRAVAMMKAEEYRKGAKGNDDERGRG